MSKIKMRMRQAAVMMLVLLAMTVATMVGQTQAANLPLKQGGGAGLANGGAGGVIQRAAQPDVSGIVYNTSVSTDAITPGSTDIGNHGDDVTTTLTLPFAVTFYGIQYTSARASSNGNLQFGSSTTVAGSVCLPNSLFSDTIFLYQSDLRTDGSGNGIYTAVLGSTPNRRLVVEWRASYFGGGGSVNAEIILSESSATITTIYGTNTNNGATAVAGLQEGNGLGGNSYTQYSCNAANLPSGRRVDYIPTQGPTPTATATPPPTGTPDACYTWGSGTALPIALMDEATAQQGGFIYTFGGVSNGANTAASYKFDGSTWTAIASLPITVEYASAVSDGTYIYVMGGFDAGTNAPTNRLYRYDPAANNYTQLANMPSAVWAATAAYMGGKIYRIGGSTDTGSSGTNALAIYNIAGNSWSAGANYPLAVAFAAAEANSSYVYVAGGYFPPDGSSTAKTYRYDTVANTWNDAAIADLPSERWGAASGQLGGKWVLAGGYVGANGGTISSTTLTSDFSANGWGGLAAMGQARARFGGETLGNSFYALGGRVAGNDFGGSTDNQRLTFSGCATATPAPPTSTPTRTATSMPPTNTATNTQTPASTPTPVPPTTTATNTSTATSTNTPTAAPTNTPTITNTPTATYTPGGPTITPALPTNTATDTPTSTNTATGVPATNTPVPPSPTVTACPVPFVDINGNVFYNAITYLYCRGVVSGTDGTHYTPAGTATRGQFAKVVVLGFGIASYTPVGNPDFTDVPSSYFAYEYIEAGFHAGILSGFDAGTCAAIGATFPCYGPNRPITRAQLTKLVVNAGQYPPYTPTSGQTFSDVGPSNVFYGSIETAAHYGIINGYGDNTFRPNNNIRRDEMAQVVYKGIINRP